MKNMKTLKKIVSVLLTISMLITMGTLVFATDVPQPTLTNNPFSNIGSTVLGYVQWFGYAMAVGMLLYIGIKYMMSSANEKANLKKGSINYIIGAVLVFAASTIVGLFKDVGSTITK